ncbi:MAG: lytic transglycosylase domain-containing protein [Bryobacteraceae bacterium]
MRICFAAAVGAVLTLAADPAAATNASVPSPTLGTGARVATVVKADPRSGRLVRRVTVTQPAAARAAKISEETDSPDRSVPAKTTSELSGSKSGIHQLVEDAAARHDVDPLLVHSVIKVESNYNQYAISNKGAVGLMQLMPATGRQYGAQNSFDARQNIEAGVKYLKHLQDLYKDDRLALAAYNAGEGAVAKYKGVPAYAETQNYVYQVGKKYGEARRAYEKKKAEEQAVAKVEQPKAEPPKPEHPKLESYTDEQGRIFLRTR